MYMDRRRLLGLLGATALGAASGPAARAATPSRHEVVIGAGILGATIAYALARRGTRVTVLEKTAPASGATGDSFAYLNASTKQPRAYYDLNVRGIAGWRSLQQELHGTLPLRWGGAVYWRDEPAAAAALLHALRQYRDWGYAGRRLDSAALRHLLPNATPGHVEGAVLYEQEGTIDPVGAVNVILARARALGVTVEFPVAVEALEVEGDRIRGVRTSGGRIEADTVVVAAGLGSPTLVTPLGVKLPLTTSIGVLAHTVPQPPLLGSAAFAPGSTIKQNPDGRIVSSSSHEGSGLTLGLAEQGEQILQSAARYFPRLQRAKIERVSIGYRVLPADGFPILGFTRNFGNLYVAVTHSGVTLAPVIAQFAMQEILEGVDVESLAPYRASRFA
jgi:glycine/D-amino acid oxidase-like deaminating enzyme